MHGGIFGLGLGFGLGTLAHVAGRAFSFYLTLHGYRPARTPMLATVSLFGGVGGVVGGAAGAITGAGIGFFSNRKHLKTSPSKKIDHEMTASENFHRTESKK